MKKKEGDTKCIEVFPGMFSSEAVLVPVIIFMSLNDANWIGYYVNYSYAPDGIYVSWIFGQIVIVWHYVCSVTNEKHEDHVRIELEWPSTLEEKVLIGIHKS